MFLSTITWPICNDSLTPSKRYGHSRKEEQSPMYISRNRGAIYLFKVWHTWSQNFFLNHRLVRTPVRSILLTGEVSFHFLSQGHNNGKSLQREWKANFRQLSPEQVSPLENSFSCPGLATTVIFWIFRRVLSLQQWSRRRIERAVYPANTHTTVKIGQRL